MAHASQSFPGGTSGKESVPKAGDKESLVQTLGQDNPLGKA